MQATLDRVTFTAALDLADRARGRGAHLPALTGLAVTLHPAGGTVLVAATDLTVAVEIVVPAEVTDAAGRAALVLPALVAEWVRAQTADRVTLELDEGARPTAQLRAGAHQSTVTGWPYTEFPPLPRTTAGAPWGELPGATLQAALRQVVYAVNDRESRPALTGLLWTAAGLTGADGYRLATTATAAPGPPLLLPARAAPLLAAAFGPEAVVALAPANEGRQVAFTAPGLTVWSTLIGATYPDLTGLVRPADEAETVVTVPRPVLRQALNAVLPFADAVQGVRLDLAPAAVGAAAGTLTLTAHAVALGRGQVTVDARDYHGPAVTISVKGPYLAAAVQAAPGAELALHVLAADRALLLRSGAYTAVLMPLVE